MTASAKSVPMEQGWGMAGRVTSDSRAGHETAGTNSKMLSLPSIALTAFLTVEVVRSFAFNSLALRSDAAPMVTYVLSRAIALLAIRTGCLSADDRRTFGYKRLDILPRHLTRPHCGNLRSRRGDQVVPEAGVVVSPSMLVFASFGVLPNIVSLRW